MSPPRYDLLAVDLDGTLLDPNGRVSEASRDAVARAREAGLEIVICTGRAYSEAADAIHAIEAHLPAAGRRIAPVVTTGGAAVFDAATDRLLHVWRLDEALVRGMCERFRELNRAPLILKDRGATGYDYLVVKYGPLEYPSKWWFSNMPLEVRYIDHIDDDEYPEDSIRLGFAAGWAAMREIVAPLIEEFGERAFIQYFGAIGGTHEPDPDGPTDDKVQLLEVFHREVTKWRGIHALAYAQGIPDERVAAIGDEINDLAMIRSAGLGIAMGNAVPEVKDAADVETASHNHDGLAMAIDKILSGEW
ncbi:MAG: HAD hydrolase family protein [Planctomycetota bacterium]